MSPQILTPESIQNIKFSALENPTVEQKKEALRLVSLFLFTIQFYITTLFTVESSKFVS